MSHISCDERKQSVQCSPIGRDTGLPQLSPSRGAVRERGATRRRCNLQSKTRLWRNSAVTWVFSFRADSRSRPPRNSIRGSRRVSGGRHLKSPADPSISPSNFTPHS